MKSQATMPVIQFITQSKLKLAFSCLILMTLGFLVFHTFEVQKFANRNVFRRFKRLLYKPRWPDYEETFIKTNPQYLKRLNVADVPGANGSGVFLPLQLPAGIFFRVREGYKRHGFNSFVSNLISVDRTVPDTRSEVCKNRVYTNLPKCSIVIPFYNEEFNLLLRTFHSVVNRSPDDLIEEIILVDDNSDHEDLREQLENHLKMFPKVRLIRNKVRQGIMKARTVGTNHSSGPVIVFLDSHTEVMHGWLEPVLDRFKHQNNVLVTMWHLSLNRDTLEFDSLYEKVPYRFGGFRWNMDFEFLNISVYERENPTPLYDPKPVPTIFGSMHAISKDFFVKIGMYDVDFDFWGGEDVELSFRVWCCGGKVEYVPCSKVAHMSKYHRYSEASSGKGGYRWNTDRIAELWLGEYRKFYYELVGDTKDRNYGDISERKGLLEKLQCKPFSWFYEHVYKNITAS